MDLYCMCRYNQTVEGRAILLKSISYFKNVFIFRGTSDTRLESHFLIFKNTWAHGPQQSELCHEQHVGQGHATSPILSESQYHANIAMDNPNCMCEGFFRKLWTKNENSNVFILSEWKCFFLHFGEYKPLSVKFWSPASRFNFIFLCLANTFFLSLPFFFVVRFSKSNIHTWTHLCIDPCCVNTSGFVTECLTQKKVPLDWWAHHTKAADYLFLKTVWDWHFIFVYQACCLFVMFQEHVWPTNTSTDAM